MAGGSLAFFVGERESANPKEMKDFNRETKLMKEEEKKGRKGFQGWRKESRAK